MSGYFRAYSIRVREASRDLPERELRVYLALLSFANCEGMCWPGIKTLVDTTGLCTDAVLEALEGLTGRLYVEVLRKGTRDALTHSMLPNVYRIEGAVIDDDCADDEYRTDDPILVLSSNEESQHHQGTDSRTQPIATQPEKPPSSPKTPSKVEGEKPKAQSKAKTKTPAQSAHTNSPSPSSAPPSPQFFNGSLAEYGQALPEAEEAAAQQIYVELRHKLPIRNARYLVATYGADRVRWAIAHLNRQTDVKNPPGYVRHLLEKHAIEKRDGEAANPGDLYVTGEYADYIDH